MPTTFAAFACFPAERLVSAIVFSIGYYGVWSGA